MSIIQVLKLNLIKIDRFGIPISLRIGRNPEFNTQFGALITLALFGILIRSCYGLVYDIFSRSNPSVITSEEYMLSPGV